MKPPLLSLQRENECGLSTFSQVKRRQNASVAACLLYSFSADAIVLEI